MKGSKIPKEKKTEEYFINVGGYIGSSTEAEIEYAKKTGKTVRYLEESLDYIFPDIDINKAFERLKKKRKSMCTYLEIMSMRDCLDDLAFQRKYTGFYRVRRNEKWKNEYFRLMSDFQNRGNFSFENILLRLFKASGQVEASFASKMLATINPEMPIWDRNVLRSLHLQLKGKNQEEKLSNAVVLYDRICRWYDGFLQTEDANNLLSLFDREFSEFVSMTPIKKIDFILWASQE